MDLLWNIQIICLTKATKQAMRNETKDSKYCMVQSNNQYFDSTLVSMTKVMLKVKQRIRKGKKKRVFSKIRKFPQSD